MLCEGGIKFQCASTVWRCWAPLTCKIFIWLALHYRLWTSEWRFRHELQDQTSVCYLCDQEDTVDHILLQCVFARHVWFLSCTRLGIDVSILPTMTDNLEEWWTRSRKRINKTYHKCFDAFCILVCWNLWKQRNGRVFASQAIANEWGTAELIHQELLRWVQAGGRGVQHLTEE